jgi:hypothetical protein
MPRNEGSCHRELFEAMTNAREHMREVYATLRVYMMTSEQKEYLGTSQSFCQQRYTS